MAEGPTAILTEAEAAERLGCSVSKLKKLRYAGRLAFIPGRPVLILERDLLAFQKLEAELKAAALREKQIKKGRYREPKPEPLTGHALIVRRVIIARMQRGMPVNVTLGLASKPKR